MADGVDFAQVVDDGQIAFGQLVNNDGHSLGMVLGHNAFLEFLAL